jgi:hypothetical protein
MHSEALHLLHKGRHAPSTVKNHAVCSSDKENSSSARPDTRIQHQDEQHPEIRCRAHNTEGCRARTGTARSCRQGKHGSGRSGCAHPILSQSVRDHRTFVTWTHAETVSTRQWDQGSSRTDLLIIVHSISFSRMGAAKIHVVSANQRVLELPSFGCSKEAGARVHQYWTWRSCQLRHMLS